MGNSHNLRTLDCQDWTIADAKQLFETGLADNPNIEACKSSLNTEIPVPESYDWREEHP